MVYSSIVFFFLFLPLVIEGVKLETIHGAEDALGCRW